MDHPRTTQQVDLGQCLLRANNSRLQLQFTATAHFSQPHDQSRAPPVKVSNWQDLSSVWVTEAPELDIRLFIRAAWGLEHAVCALLVDLGDQLCTSPIWSDLGFVVRLKDSHTVKDLQTLKPHHLTIGLCRDHSLSVVKKGWALPAILQKPPDIHPPPDVPTITLAAVDIYLEYNYPSQLDDKSCDIMACDLDSILDLDQWHYQSKIETFAVATLTVSGHEAGHSDHAPDHLDASSSSHHEDNIGDDTSTSQILLQLLDSGLQRLIISASRKRPQTRAVGKSTLQNLSQLCPAIFNLDYREAMNQRAASIPIISKALTSMLGNSNNQFLRAKLPLLQTTNGPNHLVSNTDSSNSQTTPKYAIHSALWRIAQDQTRRPVAFKRGTSFFATDSNSDLTLREKTPSKEAEATDILTEDEFEDVDLINLDQYDTFSHDTGAEPVSQLIPQPLDDSDMELICEDSAASIQTTMLDDLFIYESTQTTLDEFASACDPDPIPFDNSDTEMLL